MRAPIAFDSGSLLNFIVERDKYNDFLDFACMMRFRRRLSLFNAALIYLQRPGARFVATENAWERDYSRYIKPDATPIVILQPFGPVNFLYELEDTEGKEFKQAQHYSNEQPKAPMNKEDLLSMQKMLTAMGIYYGERSLGVGIHAFAEYMDHASKVVIPKKRENKTVKTKYAIIVNKNLSEIDKAKAILHEIGHILCGHLPKDNKYSTEVNFTDRSKLNLSKEQEEFEAEKVCEVVCKMLSIHYNTDDYLTYYEGVENAPDFSLRYVIDAADKVLIELEKAGFSASYRQLTFLDSL